MRNRYWCNLELLKKNEFVNKVMVPLGITVIILSKLENLNVILSFSFALESISQLFGLRIVLCPMRHCLWDVSSLFSLYFHCRLSIRKRNHGTCQGGFLFPGQLVRDCCPYFLSHFCFFLCVFPLLSCRHQFRPLT